MTQRARRMHKDYQHIIYNSVKIYVPMCPFVPMCPTCTYVPMWLNLMKLTSKWYQTNNKLKINPSHKKHLL
jgi:uncharacterized protein (DUF2225 family)